MTPGKFFFGRKCFFLRIRHFLLSLVSFMRIQAELSILWLFKKSSYTNFPYEMFIDMFKAPMMERPLDLLLQLQTCYHVISETSIPKGHCCGIRNFSLSKIIKAD